MTKTMTQKGKEMSNRTPHPIYDEAYIYKQPSSKNWTMDYKDQFGKRVRKSSKTQDKREALKRLGENITLIERVKSGEISITSEKKITVQYSVKETIKHLNNKIQKPAYSVYIRELKRFSSKYGELDIKEVSKKILTEHLDQGYSKVRYGMIKTALKIMLTLSKDDNRINNYPEFPSVNDIYKKKPEPREGLTEKQVEQIRARFDIKSRAVRQIKMVNGEITYGHRKTTAVERENARIIAFLIELMYETGARPGELRYLRRCDLKIDDPFDTDEVDQFNPDSYIFLKITESKTFLSIKKALYRAF